MEKEGYVYLLGDTENEGIYKIGATRGEVSKRIKSLQTGNPGEIFERVVFKTKHPFFLEGRLHFIFEGKRVSNEWFKLDEEDVSKFKETCEMVEGNIKALQDNPFFKKMIKD